MNKMYTVSAPQQPWLSEVTADSLSEAIRIKAAWAINQGASAIITDADGYIVSTREQNIEIAGY
jgi:hypothetical protein